MESSRRMCPKKRTDSFWFIIDTFELLPIINTVYDI